MSRLVPEEWMPAAAMKRIICHWTVGGYEVRSLDKEHYHIIVDGDGQLHRGKYSIADNVPPLGRTYAAHVLNLNSRSIGISAACMAGAKERPFNSGSSPLKQNQWDVLAQTAAELCQRYGIEVTPRTVLQHGEVETVLGVRQEGKWDINKLPWNSVKTKEAVWSEFRALVRAKLAALEQEDSEEEAPPSATVVLNPYTGPAVVTNGSSYAKIRPMATSLGWTIDRADGEEIKLTISGQLHTLPMILVAGAGFVSIRALGEALQMPISWEADNRQAIIG